MHSSICQVSILMLRSQLQDMAIIWILSRNTVLLLLAVCTLSWLNSKMSVFENLVLWWVSRISNCSNFGTICWCNFLSNSSLNFYLSQPYKCTLTYKLSGSDKLYWCQSRDRCWCQRCQRFWHLATTLIDFLTFLIDILLLSDLDCNDICIANLKKL